MTEDLLARYQPDQPLSSDERQFLDCVGTQLPDGDRWFVEREGELYFIQDSGGRSWLKRIMAAWQRRQLAPLLDAIQTQIQALGAARDQSESRYVVGGLVLSLRLTVARCGRDDWHVIEPLLNLAEGLSKLDRRSEAKSMYAEAKAFCMEVLGEEHPATERACAGLWRCERPPEPEPDTTDKARGITVNPFIEWKKNCRDTPRAVIAEADLDDVLKPYQIDQPLTADEVDLVQLHGELLEQTPSPLRFEEWNDRVYLRIASHAGIEPAFFALGKQRPRLLSVSEYAIRRLAVGVGGLQFRLALANWGLGAQNTLSILSGLAYCLHQLGRTGEALPLHQQARELRTQVLGKDHPDTLSSLNNLALCLQELGHTDDAVPLFQQALELSNQVLGKEHPNTITSLNGLASCLQSMGHSGEALPLYQQALELRIQILGKEHPDTLLNLNNLAHCMHQLGRRGEALPLFQQAVELNTQVLGKEHPDTLLSIQNLACCLQEQGRTGEALPLHQQTLELRTQVLGKEHPDTLGSLNNLACCLQEQGRTGEALAFFRQAIELYTRVLGKEHPNTLGSHNNVAFCLQSLGHIGEALHFFQQTLELNTRVLGKEHPNTLLSVNNLADCLHQLGRIGEALPLNQEALELSTQVLGKEHPNTLLSLNNLAQCLSQLGRTSEALPLHQQAFELSTQVLGKEHPNTLLSLNNLAHCLEALKRTGEASEYNEALAKHLSAAPQIHGTWFKLAVEVMLRLLLLKDPAPWPQYAVDLSRAFTQLMDLQLPQQLAASRQAFRTFQASFLSLCVKHQRWDLLPEWLMMVQGRQLARMMLDRRADAEGLSAEERVLYHAIDELRALQWGLQTPDRENLQAYDQHYRDRWKVYAQTYNKVEQHLNALHRNHPDFVFASAKVGIDITTLQESLAPHQTLGLLIHYRRADDSDPVLPVLLLKSNHDLVLKPFPSVLGHLYKLITVYAKALENVHRGELRKNDQGARFHGVEREEPFTLADTIADIMSEHFWKILAPLLDGVEQLELITYGDFHLFPYEIGCPKGLLLHTYPSLAIYLQRCQAGLDHFARTDPTLPLPTMPLGVQVHDAADDPEHPLILLVNAEARLINQLWGAAARTPVDFEHDSELAFLHLAAHGGCEPNDPANTYLVFGAHQEDQHDLHAVMQSPMRPVVVFISACVVGRIREDADGEPLGLVSAYLSRGARYVIAALQPVPDFFMPVLVCLFYQAWQTGLTPPEALAEAKHRLQIGAWYPATESLLRDAYVPVIAEHLASLARAGDEQGIEITLANWGLCRETHPERSPSPQRSVLDQAYARDLGATADKIDSQAQVAVGQHSQYAGVDHWPDLAEFITFDEHVRNAPTSACHDLSRYGDVGVLLEKVLQVLHECDNASVKTLCTWVRCFG